MILSYLPGLQHLQFDLSWREDEFLAQGKDAGLTRSFNTLGKHIVVALMYVSLFRFSEAFRTAEIHSSPWNPEVGVAALAGAILGPWAILTIGLSNVISGLLWSEPQFTVLLLGTSVTTAVVYVGGAHLMRHHRWRGNESAIQDILNFLFYAAATTLIVASLRLILFTVVYKITIQYYAPYAVTNAVGNLIGVLTIAPLYIAFGTWRSASNYLYPPTPTRLSAVLCAVVAAFVVFALPWTDEFKFFYLLFPPVLFLAVKDGLKGATVAILLSDLLMVGILFSLSYEPWTLTELQIFMITLSVCGLVLGAAISEREQYAKRLVESAAALQDSQRTLFQASRLTLANAVAAALAHELNQPLAASRNYIRSISLRLKEPRAPRKKLLPQIEAAVGEIDRAANMIRSTREFLSRSGASFATLSVRELILSCVAIVQAGLERDGIQIGISVTEGDFHVSGHMSQLQQVLISLIRNSQDALAFAQTRSPVIAISATDLSRPGFVEFSVSDNGPGVPASVRSKLFIPLQSDKAEGLGIGLSVSKAIVISHGGEIWIDEGFSSGLAFHSPCLWRRTLMKTKPRILIIDDDAAIRASLVVLLEAMKMSASAVESANDGLSYLSREICDCILLDVAMPELDGISALKIFRAAHPDIPIVMITGHGDVASAVQAMKGGAIDFLEKPVTDEQLTEALGLALRRDQQELADDHADLRRRFETLTPRERQIARMVERGHSTLSIAANLDISPRTVDHHRANLLGKMRATSLAQLMRMLMSVPDIK